MKVLPSLLLLTAATLCVSTTQAGIPTTDDNNGVMNVGSIIGDARSITGEAGGGSWTEIVVNLRTTQRTSPPPRGRLEIYERSSNGEEAMVDRRDVDVPLLSSNSGGAKGDNNNNDIRIHVPVLGGGLYRVRFLDDRGRGEWIGSVSTQTTGYGSLVFHYRPTTIEQTEAVRPPAFPERHDVSVATLNAMPRSVWTYDRTALFVVDASTLKSNDVDAAACTALIGWMRSGGTLAVVTDSGANDSGGDKESTRCGREQALTPETIGSGRVVTVDKQVVESKPSELGSLLGKAIDRRPNRASSHELMFLEHTDHAPRIALAGVLIALFGGLVGPGSYLFLYRRRRSDHGAATTAAARTTRIFPLLGVTSLATLSAMLLLGRAFAPSRHTTTIVVRDVTSGDTNSRIVETRVFHKPDGPLRVKRAIDGSFLGEEASSREPSSRGTFRLDAQDGTGQTIVLNEQRLPATDYVYLVESASAPLPGNKPITITCTRTTCTIDNASSMALEHARLHTHGRRFVDVGSLDAGTKRTVTLNPMDGSDYINYRSNDPEDQLAVSASMRASRQVLLIARGRAAAGEPARVNENERQSKAPERTLINVTCVTGCEDAQ